MTNCNELIFIHSVNANICCDERGNPPPFANISFPPDGLYTVSNVIALRQTVYGHAFQSCRLRPSVLGQDRSLTKKIGLGLAGLVLCCETRSCYARRRNDLEGYSNFSNNNNNNNNVATLSRRTVSTFTNYA